MSDLQCPVRVLVASVQHAVSSADALGDERVALVLSESESEASERLAQRLGTQVSVRPDDLSTLLDELADTFRGETVLVLRQPEAIHPLLASLQLPAGSGEWDETEVLVLEADAAGWRRSSGIR